MRHIFKLNSLVSLGLLLCLFISMAAWAKVDQPVSGLTDFMKQKKNFEGGLTEEDLKPLTIEGLIKKDPKDCPEAKKGDLGEFIDSLDDVVSTPQTSKPIVDENIPMEAWGHVLKFSKNCSSLIGKDGSYGKFGEVAHGFLSEKSEKPLFDGDFSKVCPKYKRMPIQQKKRFLVWALTVAVFKESSCDPNAKAKGPHGIAKGWLQLHDGKEQNYPPVKGVRKCQKGSSRHPVTTIDCFYRMASYYVPANGGTLFVEKQPNKRPPTYWDVFLSNSKAGKSTRKMMSAYKGCK